jgi:anti-sigma regulatory factor (Ser/Thr protein kinase)
MRQQATAPPASYGARTTDMNQPVSHGTWFRQLNLAARPSALPWARRMLRQMLCEWQLERMSDTALLLVSELITNAVNASADGACGERPPVGRPMIALTVRLTDTSLMMEVWDANPAPPVLQEADLTGDCGRGLLIVQFLGDKWGHHSADGGKVVWCEVAFPD